MLLRFTFLKFEYQIDFVFPVYFFIANQYMHKLLVAYATLKDIHLKIE